MARKTLHSRAKSSRAEARARPKEASEVFKITNELGLHARAAAQFVKIASRFSSDIFVRKDSREVNGKSIMGILMLAAAKGSQIRIAATGDDSHEAVADLGALVERKFGEK